MTEPIRVRGIHSDGGSDIKSVFKEFCDEHGMRFSTSDVAHPWQNGLARDLIRPSKVLQEGSYVRKCSYRVLGLRDEVRSDR